MIKLSRNDVKKILNLFVRLSNEDKFKNELVIDFRQKDQIILNENNLENKIFLFLGINKFTIVAINSTNEFVYKKETLTNNQNNQIDTDFLDNFLSENIFKIEKELNEFVKNIFLIIDNQNIFSIYLSIKNKFDNIIIKF